MVEETAETVEEKVEEPTLEVTEEKVKEEETPKVKKGRTSTKK